MLLVLDLERQLKNRRVDKRGGSRLQPGDEELGSRRGQHTTRLGGKFVQHIPLGCNGQLSAAALQANEKYWENKPGKGKAHKDGSVKAIVLAFLLHTRTASPPLTPPEPKQEYDRNANEFTVQMEELKQLMNSFRRIDQLDPEVDHCSAKLTKKSRMEEQNGCSSNCSSPTDPSSPDAGS